MSAPDEPCTRCGAYRWALAEIHEIYGGGRISRPVYRCRECNQEADPEMGRVLVGAD